MRFGLSLLLLNYSGFAKSGYFHLMQFYFTLYLADRKPFRTKLKNIGELLNSIFLVVLTYLISITFASSSSKPESSYASGYTAACFVLLAVVANLCVIIREQIQSLIRYTRRKCKTGRFTLKVGKQSWKIKVEDTKKPSKIKNQEKAKIDEREESKEEDLEEEKGLEEIVQEVNLLDGNSV